MKPVLFFSLLSLAFLSNQAFSQETKSVKKIISPTLTETYEVLKSDKHVKEGNVVIANSGKQPVVIGHFTNGKKDNIWIAMDAAGNTIQKYNYNDSSLLQNDVDQTSNITTDYTLVNSAGSSATVTPPCQIGGAAYGFYLLYDSKQVPVQALTITSTVKIKYTFDIDKNGKLTACRVSYNGPGVDLSEDIPVKNKSEELYHFIPAKVNNQPVDSQLFYTIDLNVNKSRLPDPYYSPTQGNSKMSEGIRH